MRTFEREKIEVRASLGLSQIIESVDLRHGSCLNYQTQNLLASIAAQTKAFIPQSIALHSASFDRYHSLIAV